MSLALFGGIAAASIFVVLLLVAWIRHVDPPVPMTGDCIQSGCHSTTSTEAHIYLAVNQKTGQAPVRISAGSSLELDLYFTNVVGKRKIFPVLDFFSSEEPFRAVGIEIIIDPKWIILSGTSDAPEGWSPAWQRGSAGAGEYRGTSWLPVEDSPGHFYLDFRASPYRAYADLPATAVDTGNSSAADLDGKAGIMGSDAAISIPREASPGIYEITVAGIGHDSRGTRASVTGTVPVEVTSAGAPTPSLADSDGAWFYSGLCAKCHPDTAEEKGILLTRGADRIASVMKWGTAEMAPVRGLNDGEVNLVIDYIRETAGPIPTFLPFIPHPAQEGQLCSGCHGPDGLSPAPASHRTFTSNCLNCHKVDPTIVNTEIPQVPHSVAGKCLSCHGPGKLMPAPSSHAAWAEDVCLACHQVVPEMAGVQSPMVPHRISTDKDCSACHAPGAMLPLTSTHAARKDIMCKACHQADEALIASIPLMSHSPEGREDCVACHSPAGWIPSPEDHWERAKETCLACHQ